jgi:outer membrane immunogenic protein
MKKNILVVSVLAFFSNFALADDNKFDGPYAGIHIGYDTSYANGVDYLSEAPTGWSFSNSSLGSTVFGGFVGFNKVLTNNVLVGIEADYEFQNADKVSSELKDGVPRSDYSVKSKAGDAASIRAKLGYVFNENRTLAYLTAGYAFKKLTNTNIDTEEDLTSSSSNWYKGWTVGAGGEHFVYDNLALKAEFRYTDDDTQVDSVPIYDSVYKVNFQPNKSVRIGVAYHF